MVRPSKRRRHLGPSLRRLGPGVLAAVALALIFGAIVIALVRTAGPLTSDIGMALPNPAPDVRQDAGMVVCHDCYPPLTDVGVGEALTLLGIYFGGIPVAAAGMLLAWRARRRSAEYKPMWAAFIYGALIFQLSSLLLGIIVLLIGMAPSRTFIDESRAIAAFVVFHVAWNAAGVIAFGTVRHQVRLKPDTTSVYGWLSRHVDTSSR